MKLIILLMTVAILQVSAATRAQNITMKKEQASLRQVIKEIRQQSGYDFFYNLKLIQKATPVTLNIKNMPLEEALKKVFENQPLTYTIAVAEKAVVVTEKKTGSVLDKIKGFLAQPISITGIVVDTTGQRLQGATIAITGKSQRTITAEDGSFSLQAERGDSLLITFVGYKSQRFFISESSSYFRIILHDDNTVLTEVMVSTGYQTITKERVVGSFDQIDNKLITRSTGTNILDRLNGLASGLRFNGTAVNTIATNPSNRTLGINIRGESTLSGNVSRDPLIILDNFPYEGNINNINPNDIENITILKDAAAASIWGARSGNGVIVITTKKGRKNQPLSVEVNSNITMQNKPNLYYDLNYLGASDYVDVESYLFKQGYFDAYLNDKGQPPVSPVIDLLANQRSGVLTNADATAHINILRNNDVRKDYEKYIYQKAIKQQYSVGLRGGTAQNSYIFSVGYDKNQDNLVRNGFNRVTVNALNTYTPIRNLEITTGINYSQNKTDLNNKLYWGSGISVGGPIAGIYPYAQFMDADGHATSIVKDYRSTYANSAQSNGFLDWNYRPLDELNLTDNYTKVNDLILKAGLRYKFKSYLNAEFQYQNERQTVEIYNYQNGQTYNARSLINKFTIINPATKAPTYQVPVGGMLDLGEYDLVSNNFRGQLNYSQTFNNKHNITGIVGAEVRQLSSDSFTRSSLAYDDQFGTATGNLNYADYLAINPTGFAQIPTPDGSKRGTLNRFISYFSNGSYTYDDRYIFTVSGRKDGANIFGVKTNDKVTPLWSVGLGWNISKESFYKLDGLPYLKARFSYGFNGNVYNGTAFATGKYTTASLTGAPAILNLTAPNPDLSWERVKNINIGIDFSTKNDWLSGTIEYYNKNGENLIENIPLNTSTGFLSFYGNAAATTSKGIDVILNSKNINSKFKWTSSLLLSTLNDKVTKYNASFTSTSMQTAGGSGIPHVGKSLYGIYSYRWAGLDPANGDPQGYLNGKVSKNYAGIIANYNPDSLIYNGSSRPSLYGAIRNDFFFKNISLSVNITYELGYVFRRASTSTNYVDIISANANQNVDYSERWQNSGDELRTDVPSLVYPSNPNRNTFYRYSQTLIENADNIRLQDIRLGYNISKEIWRSMPFKSLQLYGYASNLGILWRANKYGIDPDISSFGYHGYPNPFTVSFGFSANF